MSSSCSSEDFSASQHKISVDDMSPDKTTDKGGLKNITKIQNLKSFEQESTFRDNSQHPLNLDLAGLATMKKARSDFPLKSNIV